MSVIDYSTLLQFCENKNKESGKHHRPYKRAGMALATDGKCVLCLFDAPSGEYSDDAATAAMIHAYLQQCHKVGLEFWPLPDLSGHHCLGSCVRCRGAGYFTSPVLVDCPVCSGSPDYFLDDFCDCCNSCPTCHGALSVAADCPPELGACAICDGTGTPFAAIVLGGCAIDLHHARLLESLPGLQVATRSVPLRDGVSGVPIMFDGGAGMVSAIRWEMPHE